MVLQLPDGGAVDADMGVAPVHPAGLAGLVDIPVADVNPSHIGRLAIDYDDLSVVAVVEPVGKDGKVNFIKRKHFHSGFRQLIDKVVGHGYAAKRIVYKPNLDTLTRFGLHNICELFPQAVILKNIVLNVDVVGRLTHSFHHIRKFFLSVNQELDPVVFCQRALVFVKEHVGQRHVLPNVVPAMAGCVEGALDLIFPDRLSQFIVFNNFLAVNLSLPIIDSEGEVKQHADEWNENDEQQVGQRFSDVGGVVNHAQCDTYEHQYIDYLDNENPVHR